MFSVRKVSNKKKENIMKNINSKYFMMLLTLAVGSSFGLQAITGQRQQKNYHTENDRFLNAMHEIERDLDSIRDSRREKDESEVNRAFDEIESRINHLASTNRGGTLHDHHIRKLHGKLEHERRKCAHYYNELSE